MTNGFDKLLRESLSADAAADHGAECLDAALVAGWFDGTLSHAERTAVEAHAASCSRCQATIAALVRTDRPSPRVWWRAPAVRWLVPVAVAGAASLVVWIGVLRTGDADTPPGCGVNLRAPRVSGTSSDGVAGVNGSEPRFLPWSGRRGRCGRSPRRRRPPGRARKSARARSVTGMRRRSDCPWKRPTPSRSAPSRPASSRCGNRLAPRSPLPQAPEPGMPSASPGAAPAARAGAVAGAAAAPAPEATTVPSTDAAGQSRARSVAQSMPAACRARRRARAADSVARPFRALADLRVGSGRAFGQRRCDVADADHRRERGADGRYRTFVERLLAGRLARCRAEDVGWRSDVDAGRVPGGNRSAGRGRRRRQGGDCHRRRRQATTHHRRRSDVAVRVHVRTDCGGRRLTHPSG